MPAKRQLCVDCVHFRRCFELVPKLRGDETECHWDPDRFSYTRSAWDRASHRAEAVGRGGPEVGMSLNMRERAERPRTGVEAGLKNFKRPGVRFRRRGDPG